MLLEALKFYFGPAQWWNTVAYDVMTKEGLESLDDDLRKKGGRYEILEWQTGLDQDYFGKKHPPTDQVKLYAATETRRELLPLRSQQEPHVLRWAAESSTLRWAAEPSTLQRRCKGH